MKTMRSCVRWAIVAVLAGVLVACSHPPDEAQVRAAISTAAQAARDADAGDFARVLSDNFDGNDGEFDKRTLVNMLRLAHLRGQAVKVLPGPVSLERRGARYVATFTVTLAGGRGWLPRHPGMYRVTSAWRREDGAWRCYTATWRHSVR